MTSSGTSRRNLLKAAGAAGIVWTAPLITPVTAYAAGTCTSVQYDFIPPFGPAWVTPTNLDPEPASQGLSCPACLPGGQIFSSTCVCSGNPPWTSATPRTINTGTLTISAGNPSIYTAPSGCTIVDATMLWAKPSGSGSCDARFPCWRIGTGLTINGSFGQVTFTGSTTDLFPIRFRALLCCAT